MTNKLTQLIPHQRWDLKNNLTLKITSNIWEKSLWFCFFTNSRKSCSVVDIFLKFIFFFFSWNNVNWPWSMVSTILAANVSKTHLGTASQVPLRLVENGSLWADRYDTMTSVRLDHNCSGLRGCTTKGNMDKVAVRENFSWEISKRKLWKILQEMGISDHLTCLLRNLYAGQEAAVRTGHGKELHGKDMVPNWERSTSRLYIVTQLI